MILLSWSSTTTANDRRGLDAVADTREVLRRRRDREPAAVGRRRDAAAGLVVVDVAAKREWRVLVLLSWRPLVSSPLLGVVGGDDVAEVGLEVPPEPGSELGRERGDAADGGVGVARAEVGADERQHDGSRDVGGRRFEGGEALVDGRRRQREANVVPVAGFAEPALAEEQRAGRPQHELHLQRRPPRRPYLRPLRVRQPK